MLTPVFLFKNLFILILSLPSRFSKFSINDSPRKLSGMWNLIKHKPSILIDYIKFSPQHAYRLSPFSSPNIYFHFERIFSSAITTLFYVFYPSLTNILLVLTLLIFFINVAIFITSQKLLRLINCTYKQHRFHHQLLVYVFYCSFKLKLNNY